MKKSRRKFLRNSSIGVAGMTLSRISYINKSDIANMRTKNQFFKRIFKRSKIHQSSKFGVINQLGSGVNIHFVTGHEKDLDMIASAGFKFVRMDFVWQETERIKGNYEWSAYEELTNNIEKRGLRALYILDYSNRLYEERIIYKDPETGREWNGVPAPQHPESIAAFARWATAAVEHFKDDNIVWEIWNEPNPKGFWMPKSNVKQYTDLAISTCKAVKKVVPNAIIIAPAVSGFGNLSFVESFLSSSNVLKYLDAVSMHPYCRYPEEAFIHYEKLRKIIDQHAPIEKKGLPIISSEWGYSTSGFTLEKQAAYIVRMQLGNLLYNIPISIWYDWKNDGTNPKELEHNFGIVDYNLGLKPSYTTISVLNKQLKNFYFLRRINVKKNNDYILLFRNDKGIYKISAWTTNTSHPVTIFENSFKVKYVTVIDGYGNKSKSEIKKNKLLIELTDLPKYLIIPSEISIE
jgi:polysaccharide biosynthesis protein PslG